MPRLGSPTSGRAIESVNGRGLRLRREEGSSDLAELDGEEQDQYVNQEKEPNIFADGQGFLDEGK